MTGDLAEGIGKLGRVGGNRKAAARIGQWRGWRGRRRGWLLRRPHGHGCSHSCPGRALVEATAASSVSAGREGGGPEYACVPMPGASHPGSTCSSSGYLQEPGVGYTAACTRSASEPCGRWDSIVTGCQAAMHSAVRQVVPC